MEDIKKIGKVFEAYTKPTMEVIDLGKAEILTVTTSLLEKEIYSDSELV